MLIGRALGAQVAKAAKAFRGRGVIIDMHAHDGGGVPTPQIELFTDMSSTSSASMAVSAATRYGCDVVLCERKRDRLKALKARFADRAAYLSNHFLLLDFDWRRYSWAVVLNDPNGPSEHGLDVMTHIGSMPRLASDFLVMINDGALARIAGVREHCATDVSYGNGAAIIGLREKKSLYAWMRNPLEWQKRLGKSQVAFSRDVTNGKGYRGRLLVITNSLAQLNSEMFAWSK